MESTTTDEHANSAKPNDRVRIACVQCAPEYLAPEANRENTDALLDGLNADLVVLPELLPSGYFFRSEEDVTSVVEEADGATTAWLHGWAQQLDAVLVAGYPEREGDAFYNSAAIVGPAGLIDTYRKVHLFNEEKRWFEPGDRGFPVHTITTSGGTNYRLGVMICFDWYFPEAARTLALQGADVIAHPSNLVLPHCPNSMPIRARENHVFTITANRYGSETSGDETLDFIGQSSVCAPNGDVLYRGEEKGDDVFTTSIRPHEARDRRINAYNDIFADRRPEAYDLSTGG